MLEEWYNEHTPTKRRRSAKTATVVVKCQFKNIDNFVNPLDNDARSAADAADAATAAALPGPVLEAARARRRPVLAARGAAAAVLAAARVHRRKLHCTRALQQSARNAGGGRGCPGPPFRVRANCGAPASISMSALLQLEGAAASCTIDQKQPGRRGRAGYSNNASDNTVNT